MNEYITIIGWVSTVVISIFGAWSAMNARLYEVEAKIRLIEAQNQMHYKSSEELTTTLKNHLCESNKVNEAIIRIEESLKRKQDRFK